MLPTLRQLQGNAFEISLRCGNSSQSNGRVRMAWYSSTCSHLLVTDSLLLSLLHSCCVCLFVFVY